MKKYIVALFCSALLLSGCGVDTPLTQKGENFLNLVKENNLDMAYLSTAQEFQDSTTLEGLQYTIDSYDLQNFENIEWQDSRMENNQGVAEGLVSLPDGREVVVQMLFVNREEEWQMMSVRFLNPNFADEVQGPSQEEFEMLVNTTMELFVSDLQRGNFAQSYAATSQIWQDEISQDQFREAFASFLDTDQDLSFVNTTDPELLTAPSIQQTQNNMVLMTLQGQFDGGAQGNLLFDLKYVQEEGAWKLAGINLGLQDPNAETTSEETTQE